MAGENAFAGFAAVCAVALERGVCTNTWRADRQLHQFCKHLVIAKTTNSLSDSAQYRNSQGHPSIPISPALMVCKNCRNFVFIFSRYRFLVVSV